MISKASEERLADVVRLERERAAAKWREVDRAKTGPKADDARAAALWFERTANLIVGAVPELRS